MATNFFRCLRGGRDNGGLAKEMYTAQEAGIHAPMLPTKLPATASVCRSFTLGLALAAVIRHLAATMAIHVRCAPDKPPDWLRRP